MSTITKEFAQDIIRGHGYGVAPSAVEALARIALASLEAEPVPVSMKDHQFRELVNELRDIAVEYHGTQQLREHIARTVRAAMLQGADGNSPVIPDAYEIEAFGVFSATEGEGGLMLQIENFRLGTENCPQIGKENMVPKFALQAIINRLQDHCNSMGNEALVDILLTPAAPHQEVKP